mgnify:CR=1 FL=1
MHFSLRSFLFELAAQQTFILSQISTFTGKFDDSSDENASLLSLLLHARCL